jgi:thiamine kinase-like enzyme
MMEKQSENILQPPGDVPEVQRGNWFPLSESDPVVKHITNRLWDQTSLPSSWRVARLSQAAYLYQEEATEWAVVAKFYSVKKGSSADNFAHRELEIIKRVRLNSLDRGDFKAISPLDVWGGILFLEYVDGLTLEDLIAVRRSRPGMLLPALQSAAKLLFLLHENNLHSDSAPEFESRLDYFRKILDNLERYGILQQDPVVSSGFERALKHWAGSESLRNFVPVRIHGDATSSNFIYPWDGGVVAIDWERSKMSDPASDLGRLMAEVSHSIHQHGGSIAEAQPFVQCLYDAYIEKIQSNSDLASFYERTSFYQALSTLRIARNGWVSRLDRMGLVAQALALLTTIG